MARALIVSVSEGETSMNAMADHTKAELVYVHFYDRFGYHLFDLHMKKILTGFPIPRNYTVHTVDPDLSNHSINLALTNAGAYVDSRALAEHINSLRIFGRVEVGVYGIRELFVPEDIAA
jgi:hypothetical protein